MLRINTIGHLGTCQVSVRTSEGTRMLWITRIVHSGTDYVGIGTVEGKRMLGLGS